MLQNKCRSAMILINDVVYTDPQSNCIDYAEKINTWINSIPKKNIGPFKKGDINSTRLEDLAIRFGYPYFYVHLDNCEHVIIFNKARYDHDLDKLNDSSVYTVLCSPTDNKLLMIF
jgi:hypothetical protein